MRVYYSLLGKAENMDDPTFKEAFKNDTGRFQLLWCPEHMVKDGSHDGAIETPFIYVHDTSNSH